MNLRFVLFFFAPFISNYLGAEVDLPTSEELSKLEKKYFEIASQDVSIKALRELGKKFSSHCYYNKFNECLIFEVFQMNHLF